MSTKPPPARPAATGVLRHAQFLMHDSGTDHVENRTRLASIYRVLDSLDRGLPLTLIQPRPCSEDELLMVHSAAYIKQIAATAKAPYTQLSADTYACADSYTAASLSAGAVLSAIEAVCDQRVRNAFVLSRPPGHHAEASRANGYCLFNNVALGAQFARRRLGLGKVLIIDWDLHHGNGIQHMFEQDPSVLYFSTHQYPLFPGTGHLLEIGRGRGEGYTINVPLERGFNDADFAYLYQNLLEPVALSFKPDLILVAAGFDIHKKDPLGQMMVSENGFSALTRIVMGLSRACCQNRLVLALEGGYHREALAASVHAVLLELCDSTQCDTAVLSSGADLKRVCPVVRRSVQVLSHYWPDLRHQPARRLQ